MPACPVCHDEFEDHVRSCPVHGATLVPLDELPAPAVGQAQLGLFHPVTVLLVQRFLHSREAPHRAVEVDEERVELWVPADVRDDLRAALTLHWSGMLRTLEPDAFSVAAGLGGDHPGWHDAPQGAWVDDHGRLRVDASPEEEAVRDASRTVGPGLVAFGAIVLLLSWFSGFDAGPVLLGISAIVLGLLLPR